MGPQSPVLSKPLQAQIGRIGWKLGEFLGIRACGGLWDVLGTGFQAAGSRMEDLGLRRMGFRVEDLRLRV